ncbi:zinc finger protein [Trichinella spiralis]|uniref:zinc finger protein n=1 Tax=Trichinella spiralis TaxID=6334 RepID=UPI0001EFEB15|nr:zinc finger protein [Trichinella spiralis]
MCLIERSRCNLARRAQYVSALCRSLGMDEWLIRKPLSNRRKVIRKYDIDYLKFGFTWNGDHKDPHPLCVICYEILANESMWPNKLLRHIETKHMDLKSKPLQFFESKLKELNASQCVLSHFTNVKL